MRIKNAQWPAGGSPRLVNLMFEKNYFVCKHFQAVPEATTQLLRMVEREAVEILTELLPAGVVPQLSSVGESGSGIGIGSESEEEEEGSESEEEEEEEEGEHDSIAAARTVATFTAALRSLDNAGVPLGDFVHLICLHPFQLTVS